MIFFFTYEKPVQLVCFSLLQRAASCATTTLCVGQQLLLRHPDLLASPDSKHLV